MGSCIICGSSTDGAVCSIHEEDIAFIFEGDSPEQLTPNRYYRGTVDGFADFGVFVNIGDSVTGLLHRNELDQRLESLDWEAGDTVFVQVKNIRDNGNVDLSWSVRQSVDAFRGTLVDAPAGDRRRETDDGPDEQASPEPTAPDSTTAGATSSETQAQTQAPEAGATAQATASGGTSSTQSSSASTPDTPSTSEPATDQSPDTTATADTADVTEQSRERVPIDTLADRVDDPVRIEGEVVGVRQTSGPTLFEIRDETGTMECAAFEGAGVRAYPEINVGDYVRLDGVVERRQGDLQIETETLLRLAGDEQTAVADRIDTAISEAVRPEQATYPIEDDPTAGLADDIIAAATAIRRAIKNTRPVIVRHAATVDGYAAGAALERAVLPRIREEHSRSDAEYHYFKRRPLDDSVYGMSSVTDDVTTILETCERHDERKPLVVLVDLGSTAEAKAAFELLDIYDIDRIVIDDTRPAPDIADTVGTFLNAHQLNGAQPLTTTALATAVATTVEPSVRADLKHLPAISYWEASVPAYETAAEEAGYDQTDRRQLREALALEAYYQSYNDKRELIQDLLFADVDDLVAHISDQSSERLQSGLVPARENLSRKEAADVTFLVLDTDSFTHRFDFPPTELLLDELHRQERSDIDGPVVSLGVGSDELHVRSTEEIDLQGIVDRASEVVPSIRGVGGKDGHVEFLAGVREDAIEAVVGAIAKQVGSV